MKMRKLLALLIALVLTLSLLPMTVFAEDTVVIMAPDDWYDAHHTAAPSIKLGADVTVDPDMSAFNTVIDLNGHTLTFSYGPDSTSEEVAIASNSGESNLTIKDSSTKKTGQILCPDGGFYEVAGGNGTLNIESGTIVSQNRYNLINIKNGTATINISGGTLTSKYEAGYPATVINIDGSNIDVAPIINISGGEVNGYVELLAGNVTVTGGTFNEVINFSDYNDNNIPGNLTINDGTFKSNVDFYGGNITVNGGDFKGNIRVENKYTDTNVVFNDCTLNSEYEYALRIRKRNTSGKLKLAAEEDLEPTNLSVKINGGSYTGVAAAVFIDNSQYIAKPEDIQILGGTFNAIEPVDWGQDGEYGAITVYYKTSTIGTANPETYIPEGYLGYINDGKFVPTKFVMTLSVGVDAESPLTQEEKDLVLNKRTFAIRSTSLSLLVGKSEYAVNVDQGVKDGDIKVEKAKAAPGNTAAFTVTPKDGFELTGVTVKDAAGNEIKATLANGKYSFTMPLSDVTVSATFKAVAEKEKEVIADTSDTSALLPFAALMVISAAGAVNIKKREESK